MRTFCLLICLLALVPVTLYAQSITIESPAGNEIYRRGESAIEIKWSTAGITGPVRIELKTISGTPTYEVRRSEDHSPITYWIPRDVEPGSYVIEITSGDIKTQSRVFTIQRERPSGLITVTNPTADSVWGTGIRHEIRWSAASDPDYGPRRIQLMQGTRLVQTIASSLPEGETALPWTPPSSLVPGTYTIKISNRDYSIVGQSRPFRIEYRRTYEAPDFVIANFYHRDDALWVTLKNLGSGAYRGDVVVQAVFRWDSSTHREQVTLSQVSFNPNDAQTFRMSSLPNMFKNRTCMGVQFVVDPDNLIPEENDSNNTSANRWTCADWYPSLELVGNAVEIWSGGVWNRVPNGGTLEVFLPGGVTSSSFRGTASFKLRLRVRNRAAPPHSDSFLLVVEDTEAISVNDLPAGQERTIERSIYPPERILVGRSEGDQLPIRILKSEGRYLPRTELFNGWIHFKMAYVEITQPRRTAIWRAGSQQTIRWTFHADGNVTRRGRLYTNIYLTTPHGTSTIATNLDWNQNSWTGRVMPEAIHGMMHAGRCTLKVVVHHYYQLQMPGTYEPVDRHARYEASAPVEIRLQ